MRAELDIGSPAVVNDDEGVEAESREDRFTETLRRSQGAVADARRLLNEIGKAVRNGRTFVDYRSVHEGHDFIVPRIVVSDSSADILDPDCLRGDALRWYRVAKAVATHIEFIDTTVSDGADCTFIMRVHLV